MRRRRRSRLPGVWKASTGAEPLRTRVRPVADVGRGVQPNRKIRATGSSLTPTRVVHRPTRRVGTVGHVSAALLRPVEPGRVESPLR